MKKRVELMVASKPIRQMNISAVAHTRRNRIMKASLKVRTESMKVNAEFSVVEDAPIA